MAQQIIAYTESETHELANNILNIDQFDIHGPSDPDLKEFIEAACRRPEISLIAAPVQILFDDLPETPFIVENGDKITINRRALTNPSLGTLLLRHGLEIALYQRILPANNISDLGSACRLLSCHCAAIYFSCMSDCEKFDCENSNVDWLIQAYKFLLSVGEKDKQKNDTGTDEFDSLISTLASLEQLISASESRDSRQVCQLFETIKFLAVPTEHILTLGGDNRLHFDPADGLNKLGCSPRPRPWAVTFATSTASSISEPAYWEAEQLRHDLLRSAFSGQLKQESEMVMEALKDELLGACGYNGLKGTKCILAPSGTDAEFYALHLARIKEDTKIDNFIISPDETGSGVIYAVAGKHFASQTALGTSVEVGVPLEGFVAEGQVKIKTVSLRENDGTLKPMELADREITALVEESVNQGRKCLVHLLDSSKTGSGGPSIKAIEELKQKHKQSVDVVVDACQMRACPESLGRYLELGFMILITGSKFYTGPAFSGALIVPPHIAERALMMAPLASGFSDYTTRSEWPAEWDSICHQLPKKQNFGVMFRWKAALWEISAFQRVPANLKYEIMNSFAHGAIDAINASDTVELVTSPVLDRNRLTSHSNWEQVATIYSFVIHLVTTTGTERLMNMSQAGRTYRWLNMDISVYFADALSADDLAVARKCCHIGQPVQLAKVVAGSDESSATGALRLSCGSRLVWRVVGDRKLGNTITDRLNRQIEDIKLAIRKIEIIAQNYFKLEQQIDNC